MQWQQSTWQTNSGSGKATGYWHILWCTAHKDKKILCVYNVFFNTFRFKMVQIFLPIVVYTQWIFKYIQPWNNVGKTAIEKQSTELAVANPVSNNREWEIVLLNSQPSLSPFLFNNKRSSVNVVQDSGCQQGWVCCCCYRTHFP